MSTKKCERCPKGRIPGERFCGPCKVRYLGQMTKAGYFDPPVRTPEWRKPLEVVVDMADDGASYYASDIGLEA